MPTSSLKPHLFKIIESSECTEAKSKVKATKQDTDLTLGDWGSPIKINNNPAQQLMKIKASKMMILNSKYWNTNFKFETTSVPNPKQRWQINIEKPHLCKIIDSLECTEEKLKVKAPKQDIDITFDDWGSPTKMNNNPAQPLMKMKANKMMIFNSK